MFQRYIVFGFMFCRGNGLIILTFPNAAPCLCIRTRPREKTRWETKNLQL